MLSYFHSVGRDMTLNVIWLLWWPWNGSMRSYWLQWWIATPPFIIGSVCNRSEESSNSFFQSVLLSGVYIVYLLSLEIDFSWSYPNFRWTQTQNINLFSAHYIRRTYSAVRLGAREVKLKVTFWGFPWRGSKSRARRTTLSVFFSEESSRGSHSNENSRRNTHAKRYAISDEKTWVLRHWFYQYDHEYD